MPEQPYLILEEDAGIATVTMNRGDKRNPLSTAMMSALIDSFEQLGERREIRVVILAGAGPAFSAGHDLSEMRERELDFYRHEFDLCARLMQTVQAIAQPVIARVHGVATAAGCQLVATCDLAIASEQARFATPGVKIGLFCSTPMVALSRAIGRKRAMEMLLSGQPIDAQTAAAWGFACCANAFCGDRNPRDKARTATLNLRSLLISSHHQGGLLLTSIAAECSSTGERVQPTKR